MTTLAPMSLADSLLDAWATNDRVMRYFVERLPPAVWVANVPEMPRRTVRMIAAHVHNARTAWIRTLGAPHGVAVPAPVDRHRATPAQVAKALEKSGRGIGSLLALAIEHGGRIPPTPKYVWRNLPLDVGHVLTYFVSHEGHHRGQIVLAARQIGERLEREVTDGLWQWNRRAIEAQR